MRAYFLAVVVLLAPLSASATFHLWDITEVYSNADGSVQFVELTVCNTAACQGENLLTGQTITSLSASYTFPHNIGTPTGGHRLLLATPAFASQPGAVPPDFVLDPLSPPGTTKFMSLLGADTINFAAGTDTFGLASGELPTDGVNSLNEPFGSNVRTTAPNSPTNFAGQVGPEPSASLMMLAGTATVFGLARRRARSHRR